MSSVKHQPATPLPYRAEEFTVKAVSHGAWFTVARTNEPRFTPEARRQHAENLARAANAYPKLVEALRRCAQADRDDYDAAGAAEDLLSDLGEAP
jgi:hypothetical protein